MNQPVFSPPPGGYDDAIRRSRRRRSRRRARTGAVATGALAVAAAAILAGGTAGISSLRQEQPAGPGGIGGVSGASPTPDSGSASSAPQTGRTSRGESSPAASAARGESGQRTQARSSAAPGPSAAPLQISTALARTEHPYTNTSPCADSSGRQAAGWCVQFLGPYGGESGKAVSLTLDLCRLPAFADADASFPSSAEAAFALTTSGQNPRRVWSYASQHPGSPDPHRVAVRSGQCLSWTTTWWNRDDRGAAVPPGDYILEVSVDADNVPDPNAVSTQAYNYRVR